MMSRVVGAHWHELAATGYIGLILLLITSFTGEDKEDDDDDYDDDDDLGDLEDDIDRQSLFWSTGTICSSPVGLTVSGDSPILSLCHICCQNLNSNQTNSCKTVAITVIFSVKIIYIQ